MQSTTLGSTVHKSVCMNSCTFTVGKYLFSSIFSSPSSSTSFLKSHGGLYLSLFDQCCFMTMAQFLILVFAVSLSYLLTSVDCTPGLTSTFLDNWNMMSPFFLFPGAILRTSISTNLSFPFFTVVYSKSATQHDHPWLLILGKGLPVTFSIGTSTFQQNFLTRSHTRLHVLILL